MFDGMPVLHGDTDPATDVARLAAEGGDAWLIGFVGSTVTAVTFLAVAVALFRSLNSTKQWHSNPLGVGTLFLFITCGGGHLVHSLQLMYAWVGYNMAVAEAARAHYLEWHLWVVDGATAIAGTWYWTMRKKFPHLVSGTAVYEDLRKKHGQALEIHDNVVQGIVKAKMSLDLDREEGGRVAIEDTLAASERIIDDLIGKQKEMLRRVDPDGGEA